jgi:hypothetical protein
LKLKEPPMGHLGHLGHLGHFLGV